MTTPNDLRNLLADRGLSAGDIATRVLERLPKAARPAHATLKNKLNEAARGSPSWLANRPEVAGLAVAVIAEAVQLPEAQVRARLLGKASALAWAFEGFPPGSRPRPLDLATEDPFEPLRRVTQPGRFTGTEVATIPATLRGPAWIVVPDASGKSLLREWWAARQRSLPASVDARTAAEAVELLPAEPADRLLVVELHAQGPGDADAVAALRERGALVLAPFDPPAGTIDAWTLSPEEGWQLAFAEWLRVRSPVKAWSKHALGLLPSMPTPRDVVDLLAALGTATKVDPAGSLVGWMARLNTRREPIVKPERTAERLVHALRQAFREDRFAWPPCLDRTGWKELLPIDGPALDPHELKRRLDALDTERGERRAELKARIVDEAAANRESQLEALVDRQLLEFRGGVSRARPAWLVAHLADREAVQLLVGDAAWGRFGFDPGRFEVLRRAFAGLGDAELAKAVRKVESRFDPDALDSVAETEFLFAFAGLRLQSGWRPGPGGPAEALRTLAGLQVRLLVQRPDAEPTQRVLSREVYPTPSSWSSTRLAWSFAVSAPEGADRSIAPWFPGWFDDVVLTHSSRYDEAVVGASGVDPYAIVRRLSPSMWSSDWNGPMQNEWQALLPAALRRSIDDDLPLPTAVTHLRAEPNAASVVSLLDDLTDAARARVIDEMWTACTGPAPGTTELDRLAPARGVGEVLGLDDDTNSLRRWLLSNTTPAQLQAAIDRFGLGSFTVRRFAPGLPSATFRVYLRAALRSHRVAARRLERLTADAAATEDGMTRLRAAVEHLQALSRQAWHPESDDITAIAEHHPGTLDEFLAPDLDEPVRARAWQAAERMWLHVPEATRRATYEAIDTAGEAAQTLVENAPDAERDAILQRLEAQPRPPAALHDWLLSLVRRTPRLRDRAYALWLRSTAK